MRRVSLQGTREGLASRDGVLRSRLTSLPQPVVGLAAVWMLRADIHPLIPCALQASSVGVITYVAIFDLLADAARGLGSWTTATSLVLVTASVMAVYHEVTDPDV